MRIKTKAPCRIDLAGGTLDIPPLFLLLPEACTVNLAISVTAEVEIEDTDGELIELSSVDSGISWSTKPRSGQMPPPGLELAATVVGHLAPEGGLAARTKSNSPPGAGIGASSALCVALVKALLTRKRVSLEAADFVRLCLDLEARVLGTPAGYQDFYAALNGGLQDITYEPGKITAARLDTDPDTLRNHILLAYTGKPHHSGLNNWEVFKRFIDGNRRVRSALCEIGYTAVQMAGALRSGDLDAVGHLLAREWAQRKELWPGVSTPAIDELIGRAEKLGGAGKACGAGGGGCVILWHDGRREVLNQLRRALDELGAKELDWEPDINGCRISKA
ncbi:MAG TPA: hypothetical protein VMX35_09645 [Acidobacteriota bacterium]|nr:hypothetical protein [Acidobacteriota bacterium]